MMDAQTQEHLKRIERDHKMMKLHTGDSYLGGVTEFLLQLVREQETEISKLYEENSQLSDEVRHFKNELCIDDETEDDKEECSYCGERVEKVHGTPFLADAGAVMCRDCWNMTREEYIGTEGTDIGPFDDEDALEEST